MAKTKISEFDTNPANNTDINSINIAEGCAPSGINNAIRQLMADLKEQQTGASGDSFVVGGTFTATGAAIMSSTLAVAGNANLSGSTNTVGSVVINGQRITGDLSATTVGNRVMFKTNVTNGDTDVAAIPNGTSTVSAFRVHNASDPTNASNTSIQASSTESSIRASITGTGTYLPMTFYTNGNEAMRVETSGSVGIGISSPGAKLAVSDGTVQIGLNPSSGVGYVGNVSNHPLGLFVNNSEKARITTSGLLQFDSGYGSVATAYGCRAWVNFNGTGVVAIRASGNVSSITDNGTGDYRVNFTNAMPDVNFCTTGSVWNTVDGGSTTQYSTARVAGLDIKGASGIATTSVSVLTKATATDTSPGNVIDFSGVFVSVFR